MIEPMLAEESIFLQALEIPSAKDQAFFLDRACGANRQLRTAVEALLHAHEKSGDLLDLPKEPFTRRYELCNEIDHGGMGVVYRAIDTILGREVAVKVLLEKFVPASAAARRFADEAHITAQLQHPAIPPVHDLGTLPDGRPYLAMKLIGGETLEDLLADRPNPSHGRSRFIAAFEQICQALAYAHDRHVIHRDLKPANVMMGSFGEVQVMDWGLAKVLSNRSDGTMADTDETLSGADIRSTRESDGSETQAGSVLGTPAFMPPEQAVGAIGKIDERSDVFGLGAILAVVLTGQPPYSGTTAEMTRVLAARGKVDECFVRLDSCGADPELVALCKRCLAPEPEDRPADAGEVAGAVANLRAAADERARQAELDLVKAEGERVLAEARVEEEAKTRRLADEKAAEQRKRRQVQLFLAGAVGLLLLGVGAFGWWHDREATRQGTEAAGRDREERDRLKRNAEAVTIHLNQCEEAMKAGDAAKAGLALEAAEKRAAEGGAEDLAYRVNGLRADLMVFRELDAVDLFRWTPMESRFPSTKEVVARYRGALGNFRADPDATQPEAAAARVAVSAVRDRLVAAFDRVLTVVRSDRVRNLLRHIDPDPYRDAVRDAIMAGDTARMEDLLAKAEARDQPPGFVAVLGENESVPVGRRRELLGAAVRRRPGDLGVLMSLGQTYPLHERDGADVRLRWYQAAIALAPSSPATHNLLGIALHDRGDLDGALAAYTEAIRVAPTYAPARFNLGGIWSDKGNQDGAMDVYKEAIRLDPTCAAAHYGIGLVRQRKNDPNGAVVAYREAIRFDPEYVPALVNLGHILVDKGDLDGAVAELKAALRIDHDHPIAHYNLGLALRRKGDLDGAINEYKEAIRIRPRYTDAHTNLGWVLQLRGDLDGAVTRYKDALLVDPNHSIARDNLAGAERMRELQHKLPGILSGKAIHATPAEACEYAELCGQPFQKRYASAVGLFEKAFGADPKLVEAVSTGHRYNAACYAALAARGDGVDSPVAPNALAALRTKALAWLKDDLALHRKHAVSSSGSERKSASETLSHWLKDSDLTGTQGWLGRTGMPSNERAEWDAFWEDVKATLAEAQKPAPPPEVAPAPRASKR